MYYKRVELKVTNQGIHERKIFQGVKIFSRSKLSKDQKSILTQKLYLTPKQNIVYYQRTDVNYDQNWHHNKGYYELTYGQLDRETVFKVCQDFDDLSPFLENELLEKLKEKQSAGKFFEKLDI
ncbi:EXLDI protein [Streptococcus gordonii]|uniref:EXLDI protein n=1 Tax=Streptococcus gordonii TaxID=1302 RepID=UPI0020008F2F|nr:EXLDI protein [Streptococcus gordonii]